MIHLIKLAVGARDVAAIRRFQAARLAADGAVRHRTRNTPRRAAELTAGGSIYWVVAGALQARQRVLAIEPACQDDGTPCAALVLDPALVAIRPRAVRPFQGWRYLPPEDAPPDRADGEGPAELPEPLVRALRDLALL